MTIEEYRKKWGLKEEKQPIKEKVSLSDVIKLNSTKNESKKQLNKSTNKLNSYMANQLQGKTPFSSNVNENKKPAFGQNTRYQEQENYSKAVKDAKSTDKYKKLQTRKMQDTYTYEQDKYNYDYAKTVKAYEDPNLFDKTIGRASNAVLGMFDLGGRRVRDDFGNVETKESMSQLRDRLIDGSYKTKVGKFAGSVISEATKSLTAEALNAFTFGLGGSALYAGDIFADTYGNAKQRGYDDTSSLTYGLLVSGENYLLSKVFGAVGQKVYGTEGGLSTKIADGIFNKTNNKFLSNLVANAVSEGGEEFVEEWAQNLTEYAVLYKGENWDKNFNEMMNDALYSATVGAVLGSMVGPNNLSNDIIENAKSAKDISTLDDYKETLDNFKPRSPEEAEVKEDILSKIENKKEEIQQATSSEIKIDEKNALDSIQKQLDETKKAKSTIENTVVNDNETKNEVKKQESPVKEEVVTDTETKEEPKKVKEETKEVKEEKVIEKPVEDGKAKVLKAKYEALTMREKNSVDQIIKLRSELKEGKLSTASANNQIGKLMQGLPKNAKLYLSEYTRYNAELMRNKTSEVTETSELKEQKYSKEDISNDSKNDYDNILKYIRKKGEKVNDYADFDGTKEAYENYLDKKLNKIANPTKSKTVTEVENKAKKAGLSEKETKNVVNKIEHIEKAKSKSSENISEDNITITKKGIKGNISEKIADDVIRIESPNVNPETIDIGDNYKVKKPSKEMIDKSMDEVIDHYMDNLSSKEKSEIEQETRLKKRKFAERIENFAKNTNDKELMKNLKEFNDENYYEQLDIKLNLLNQMKEAYIDADGLRDSFERQYYSGLKGDTVLVNDNMIAQAQGLLTFYLNKGDSKNASEISNYLKKMATSGGQTVAQFKALYQYTPYGIYMEANNLMEASWRDAVKRHDSLWAEKNNPETNPDSKYKFSQEDMDYILKESTELHDLHAKDYSEYCKRKGELQKFIGDRIPHSKAEGFGSWVRTSLLLGTRTIFKNDLSNKFDTAYHATNKVTYSIYDKVLSNKTNIRTAGISIDGSIEGVKAGIDTSKQVLSDMLHSTSTTEFTNRYSTTETSRENVTSDFFGTMPTRYQTKIKALNDVGNWLSQLSNNTMSWGDAKFAAASYADNRLTLLKRNALAQHLQDKSKNIIYDTQVDSTGTYTVSYINTDGQYAKALTTNMEDFIKNNNMKEMKYTKDIDKLALHYAESRTYTGDTEFSKVTSSIINCLDNSIGKVPIIRKTGIKASNFIVPFSRVGSNLCYRLYRTTLLSVPSIRKSFNNYRAELATGEVSFKTQNDLVSRLGDVTTGTIMYAVIGSLAKATFDNIKGDEDDDETSKVKKFMKSIFGSDTYTFKIGDMNVSYDLGGNLSNMLKLGVDTTKTINSEEDKTLEDFVNVVGKDLLEEWTVNNITELLDSKYDGVLKNILSQVARIPSMAIPTFMKDVSTSIDDFTQRTVYDDDYGTYMINSIKDKLPGIRGTLDPKTDSWQNTMKTGSDLFTNVWNTYVASNMLVKDKSDAVSQEVMNMYMVTDKAAVIPNVSKSNFSYQSVKYDLTDEEEQRYLKTYATSAYNNLDKLFSSEIYQNAITEDKLKYIQEVYDYANDEAKKEYLEEIGIEYFNEGQKIIISGQNDKYQQSTILNAIDKNISYQSAKAYGNDTEMFNYYNSYGSYDIYTDANNNIKNIQDTYSNAKGFSTAQRKTAVIEYVNSLPGLTPVQKAMLIKEKYHSSYKGYDNQIKNYLKSQDLSEEAYQKALNKMGIK